MNNLGYHKNTEPGCTDLTKKVMHQVPQSQLAPTGLNAQMMDKEFDELLMIAAISSENDTMTTSYNKKLREKIQPTSICS